MNSTKAYHSKGSDIRATPQEFFEELDKEFNFTLDACATFDNAKCLRFFTEEDDGLQQDWTGRVWCNPPYSSIYPWMEKAQRSIEEEGGPELVVLLVPSRTGTDWWHEIAQHHEIRWIRGRLKFNGETTNAPFDCCLVIMRRKMWGEVGR